MSAVQAIPRCHGDHTSVLRYGQGVCFCLCSFANGFGYSVCFPFPYRCLVVVSPVNYGDGESKEESLALTSDTCSTVLIREQNVHTSIHLGL